jgi:4-amino-4-deoxy-L-arabinose transferase-like glycosyltransferase
MTHSARSVPTALGRPASKASGWAWRGTPLGLAVAVLAWLTATLWARPLMLPDEGRYVGVAWEMLRSGDWLTPTLDGLPYFHKPPLFYWLTAGAMRLLGVHDASARVAPLLGALLGAWALWWFTRRWLGEAPARRAMLALAVQPMFFLGAQFANMDMLVAGCITATTALLADAALRLEAGQPIVRRLLWLAYACAGLGVLAKGLIGVVIPALVIGTWLLLAGRWRTVLRLLSLPGAVLLLAVAGPWFAAMAWLHPGFAHYFFVVQHLQRYAAGGFNNLEPAWFYPALLLATSLPVLPWLLRGALLARPVWRQAPSASGLMGVWPAVVVLFFSLPASKPVGYVLPALGPLAVLVALGLRSAGLPVAGTGASAHWLATVASRWWGGQRTSLALSAALCLGAVALYATHPAHSKAAMGHTLRALRTPGQPVFLIDRYDFDLPLHARLGAPVAIVSDWHNPAIAQHDSWQHEVLDAAAFRPDQAAAWLIDTAEFRQRLCQQPVAWVVTAADQSPPLPAQTSAVAEAHTAEATLWRVRSACGG